MLPLLLAAAILAAPTTPTDRLAAFILRTQPRAKSYVRELASRILVESKAHELDPAIMAAIAWIESDYRRRARNARDGSHGLWQLMARDSYMRRAWAALRKAGRTTGYPERRWWRLTPKDRRRAMRDVRIGTYMAHYEIREALRVCARLGHRVGRSSGRHRDHLERYGHFNSGNRWPRRGYIWQLRKRTKQIRRHLNGK